MRGLTDSPLAVQKPLCKRRADVRIEFNATEGELAEGSSLLELGRLLGVLLPDCQFAQSPGASKDESSHRYQPYSRSLKKPLLEDRRRKSGCRCLLMLPLSSTICMSILTFGATPEPGKQLRRPNQSRARRTGLLGFTTWANFCRDLA